MVSSRRRPGVFLLAIATMMFSLVLLSATSSRAQTESQDQNNSANAAGERRSPALTTTVAARIDP